MATLRVYTPRIQLTSAEVFIKDGKFSLLKLILIIFIILSLKIKRITY